MITVNTESNGVDEPHLGEFWLNSICNTICSDHGHETGTIAFIFSTDKTLRELKMNFFKEDVYTDVISFNLEDDGDPVEGEVYISLERIAENAKNYKVEFIKELRRIIIHGILHLMGLDDQSADEKEKMTHLENKYLNSLGELN